jgi:hypothetical protein
MPQIVRFQLAGNTLQAKSDAQGFFSCPCSYHQDPSIKYISRAEFINHINLVQQVSTTLDSFTFLGRHLLETPTLARFGLVINTQHQLLLCLSCPAAVVPSQLKCHLSKHNSPKVGESEKQELLHILTLCKVESKALPKFQDPVIPAIEGLEVMKGYPCPQCSTVRLTYESLKTHMRQMHMGVAYPSPLNDMPTQQLKKGLEQQLLRVHVPQDLPSKFSTADILAQADGMMQGIHAELTRSEPSSDPRNFCPWLRRVRWQDLTTGKDIQELVALVSHPNTREFPFLLDGFLDLVRSATPLFDNTSELILQRLNTPKPIDE